MDALGIFAYADNEHHRDIVRGAAQHAHARRRTVAYVAPPVVGDDPHPALIEALTRRSFGAVLVQHHASPALGALLAATEVPVVALTGRPLGFRGPVVRIDGQGLGSAAAGHLLAQGLRRFAFVGYDDPIWALERLDGFRARLAASGHRVEHFAINRRHHGGRWRQVLPAWLRERGPGIGVYCQSDVTAAEVMHLCLAAGMTVPGDVAVIGTDNDRFICETACPALSSVRIPAYACGDAAAGLAERMLAGERLGDLVVSLASLGVAARCSTEVVTPGDPELAAALHFIRHRWRDDIAIGQVAAAAGISRRVLERRFVRALGRSPLDEIRRQRIDHAQRLLTETDLGLREIAGACGISSPKRLCIVFKQVVGLTPGAFRSRMRSA